ncbi:hypothetical protein ACFWTE_23340 [Nocardiopsis sp. NPDC058631]|uniref:hypothetical protein n=1 Tax=Nocardiopsis sp. NPDC058631 TaxID=3346566 RepID=UPI0036570A76
MEETRAELENLDVQRIGVDHVPPPSAAPAAVNPFVRDVAPTMRWQAWTNSGS